MKYKILFITLILITVSFSFQVSASFCYQESANVSTSCSGLDTGNYGFNGSWTNPQNTVDGNWNNFGVASSGQIATLYINYTKPSDSLISSLWQIRFSDEALPLRENLSIPLSCWSQNPLQFIVVSDFVIGKTVWSCSNSSSSILLRNFTGGVGVYEEAMWWNFLNPCTDCQPAENINLTLDGSAIQNENAILLTLGEGVAANDTCTCPGLNQNWVVDMNDNCSLTVCELGTGTLSFINTTTIGTAYCNGNINTTDMGPAPDTFTFFINSTCNIGVRS